MLVDLWLSGVWLIVAGVLVHDSFFTDEFILAYRNALQGIEPFIDAVEPWTFIVPFNAYGLVLNFVIAAWILYWPIRLNRWAMEWVRGKGGQE